MTATDDFKSDLLAGQGIEKVVGFDAIAEKHVIVEIQVVLRQPGDAMQMQLDGVGIEGGKVAFLGKQLLMRHDRQPA